MTKPFLEPLQQEAFHGTFGNLNASVSFGIPGLGIRRLTAQYRYCCRQST
jgi:hypothetical protein